MDFLLGGEIGIIICAIAGLVACVTALILLRKSLVREARKYCVSRRAAGRERMLLKPSRRDPVVGRSLNETPETTVASGDTTATPTTNGDLAITSGDDQLAVSGPPARQAITAGTPSGRGSKRSAPQPPTSPLVVTPGSVIRVSPIFETDGECFMVMWRPMIRQSFSVGRA